MSIQTLFKCPSCGFTRAIYDEDRYTKCWHCDICGYKKSEPGDELFADVSNDKAAWAHVHREWGLDVYPKEITVVKAKKLANLYNYVIDKYSEYLIAELLDIMDYLRYKYKITNKILNKYQYRTFKQLIRNLFSEE